LKQLLYFNFPPEGLNLRNMEVKQSI